MAEFTLSAVAAEDLKEIFRYGCESFGESQAEHYQLGLHHQFELIAGFPGMGLPANLPGHDLYSFGYGMHIIIYSRTDDGVNIEFLFDGRMDWMGRLKGQ